MSFSRRKFLHGCTVAATARLVAPTLARPTFSRAGQLVPGIALTPDEALARVDASSVKALALRAVDAAKTAGASYADVRLTRTVTSTPSQMGQTVDREEFAVGVRALVDGVWGFAASPWWRPDEMSILAQSAVAQARANTFGVARRVELSSAPVVTGDWTQPIEIDPFSVSLEEKNDFIAAIQNYVNNYRLPRTADPNVIRGTFRVSCLRQERALATSEGSYVTQTLYRTTCNGTVGWGPNANIQIPFRGLAPAGRGWELLRDAKLAEQVPELWAEADEILRLPAESVMLGRYDLVCDAETMASIVGQTVGVATDFDRAVGAEANAGGSSYLGPDPLEFLGTFRVGASPLTVTADRSLPGGLATVKWDDEGVEPDEVALVKDGILNDYQTSRAQAPRLARYYEAHGRPVRSHGHVGAESALFGAIQDRPNLGVQPGATERSMADLVKDVKAGFAVYKGSVTTDYQGKNGMGSGWVTRKITNGVLGSGVVGAAFLFGSTELLKNLAGLGGAKSVETFDVVGSPAGFLGSPEHDMKGQPTQTLRYSVRSVPALFRDVAIIDRTRRA